MVVTPGKQKGEVIWETPQDLFDNLNKEFNFTLDPCCIKEIAKCKKFFTSKENGLIQDWSKDIVFMNPPYGRELKKWLKKAYEEYQKGSTVICLIMSSTDTNYWHDYAMKAKEIRLIKGRLSFRDCNKDNYRYNETYPCMYPTAIIIFDKHNQKYPTIKSIDIEGNELE